jgi:hypothetical protein
LIRFESFSAARLILSSIRSSSSTSEASIDIISPDINVMDTAAGGGADGCCTRNIRTRPHTFSIILNFGLDLDTGGDVGFRKVSISVRIC